MEKQEPVQPRGASKYKHFPNTKLCLIASDEGFGGSVVAIAFFSGANSFPLIRTLQTSPLANLPRAASWAVKSNGKCGLAWHSLKSELKGCDGEAGRLPGKDSHSKLFLHMSGLNSPRCLEIRS